MDHETKPPLIPTSRSTIPELISYLRSKTQDQYFEYVTKILLSRENDLQNSVKEMSLDLATKNKDLVLIESKNSQLVLEKGLIEEELKKCRLDRDEVRDQLKKFRFECEEVREKMMRLDEELSLYVGKEKRAVERYGKLVEDSRENEGSLRKVIKELSDKIEILSGEKSKAEAESVAWMMKYEHLDERLLKLEEEVVGIAGKERWLNLEEVIKQEETSEQKISVEGSSSKLANVKTEGSVSNLSKEVPPASPCAGFSSHTPAKHCNGLQGEAFRNGGATSVNLVSGAENFSKTTGSSLAGGKQTGSQEVIELDSDDEKPLRDVSTPFVNAHASDMKSDEKIMSPDNVNIENSRKRGMENTEDSLLASNSKRKRAVITCKQEISDDANTPIGKQKVKSLWGLDSLTQSSPMKASLDMPRVVGNNPTNLDSRRDILGVRRCTEKSETKLFSSIPSDSSDSSSDSDDDHLTNNLIASLRREREKQGWAFEADMLSAFERDNELCLNAVCALHRQSSSLASFNTGGFQVATALRGKALAKFLIAGDEQGKLKKTVSELQECDPKGLDDCRKLAKIHSKQLFNIYQKKQDPFFFPPSIPSLNRPR